MGFAEGGNESEATVKGFLSLMSQGHRSIWSHSSTCEESAPGQWQGVAKSSDPRALVGL